MAIAIEREQHQPRGWLSQQPAEVQAELFAEWRIRHQPAEQPRSKPPAATPKGKGRRG
jgi:hypothetical protein